MVLDSKLIKLLKTVLVLAILISIGIFLWSTDLEQLGQEISLVGWSFLLVILISFTAYLFGTLSWLVCLPKNISLYQLFRIRQICETVAIFNPTSVVGGDLLKIHYLKNHQIDTDTAGRSVILSRVTVMLSQIALLTTTLLWLNFSDRLDSIQNSFRTGILLLAVILILVQLGFFFWVIKSKDHNLPTTQKSGKNWFMKSWNKMVSFLVQIPNIYHDQPTVFWKSYFLAMIHWVIGSLEFIIILHALGYSISIAESAFLDMGIILVKSIGAFVPGQIGVEELGNQIMLASIGITSISIWLTISLIRRARQLFWLIIGFIMYISLKKYQSPQQN